MRRLILRTVRTETVATLVTGWLSGALGLGLATGAGAVATVALMALGPLLGAMLLLIRHNLDLASRIGNLATESTRTLDTVRRLEADTGKQVRQAFRQLEAQQNLSAMLPAGRLLPATRGWAASPDLLAVLVDMVIAERPSLIVECGSGASTLWLALAMRRFEIDGRVIALEHDPGFGDTTRGFLARHGVEELAEVRDAPLESFSLDGETYSWYSTRAWEDLSGVDLLFVDGPPAATGHHARYPALPLLSGALSPAAAVVLDDLVVPDMEAVLRLWLDAYPEFGSEILPLEKRAAVLRRRCLSPWSIPRQASRRTGTLKFPRQPAEVNMARADDGGLTPVMVRFTAAELETVDTLIAAGIASSRAEAIRWALARIRERPAYEGLRGCARETERLKAEF